MVLLLKDIFHSARRGVPVGRLLLFPFLCNPDCNLPPPSQTPSATGALPLSSTPQAHRAWFGPCPLFCLMGGHLQKPSISSRLVTGGTCGIRRAVPGFLGYRRSVGGSVGCLAAGALRKDWKKDKGSLQKVDSHYFPAQLGSSVDWALGVLGREEDRKPLDSRQSVQTSCLRHL